MVRKMVKPDTVVNPDENSSAEFQAALQRREREAAIEVLYTMGAHFVQFNTDELGDFATRIRASSGRPHQQRCPTGIEAITCETTEEP